MDTRILFVCFNLITMAPKIFALPVPLVSVETRNSTHAGPKLLESNAAWLFGASPQVYIQEAQLLPSDQEVVEK